MGFAVKHCGHDTNELLESFNLVVIVVRLLYPKCDKMPDEQANGNNAKEKGRKRVEEDSRRRLIN